MYRFIIFAIFISLTWTSVSGSEVYSKGHIDSLASEQLRPIIFLPHCPGIRIQEWSNYSSDKDSANLIDDVCSQALIAFPIFIKTQHLTIYNQTSIRWNLIFLPNDSQYRHLNDLEFRFAETDRVESLGYTHFSSHDSFVFNQIIKDHGPNQKFEIVLAHELYHAMAFNGQVYKNLPIEIQGQQDEYLAHQFTRFLGLGS